MKDDLDSNNYRDTSESRFLRSALAAVQKNIVDLQTESPAQSKREGLKVERESPADATRGPFGKMTRVFNDKTVIKRIGS